MKFVNDNIQNSATVSLPSHHTTDPSPPLTSESTTDNIHICLTSAPKSNIVVIIFCCTGNTEIYWDLGYDWIDASISSWFCSINPCAQLTVIRVASVFSTSVAEVCKRNYSKHLHYNTNSRYDIASLNSVPTGYANFNERFVQLAARCNYR